ncbi:type II toxin-antitoxin system Phd/YefM family antitoxin [Actinacidiphila bryophytorum]|uniref:type II toxin-antitoxin system Phd/YefM family antitoxin n=1 Tax=Actinacidiphila bryophytorum TaxID=1436133 RepID=UPI002176DCFB|nr:type II toxin-antitoxin system prevent-host-death family antitoxin [Actinacidiphila bryophytorum]UWE07610.1 type II toxin-antitoxin system prevent-host-death family antitoxin [Actinacidiphila bryophytorum]
MRLMSAAEASRDLGALLDAVERGETIVITRAGRHVALIGPAPTGNGAALNAVLAAYRPDEDLARDVHATRALLA